jgi:PAS domain S-box-containing protein
MLLARIAQMTNLTATLSPIWAMAAYLLPCFTSVLAVWVTWQGFHRLHQAALREMAFAFAAVAAIQAVLLVVAGTGWVVPGPLLGVLECTSAAVMGWAFLGGTRRVFLIGALSICGVLGAFVLSLWQLTGTEPPWVMAMWSLASMILYGIVTVALSTRRHEQSPSLIVALAMLTLGALLGAVGSASGMLALRLIAFPLVPVALMQLTARDLQGAQRELWSFSEHSLRQTQQLLMLLRTSTKLVSEFDVDAILREAAEGIALGIGADSALIALLDDASERTMRVQALYPPSPVPHDTVFRLSAQPAIASAVQLGQQVALGPSQRGIHALAALTGNPVGPAVIQPMIYRERTIGVLVALNGHSGRAFNQDEQRVLEAFGAQAAAVAENASLYKRLDTQARELAELLATRKEEAGRQAAILASIADGVIVTDSQDRIMLANPAAARIIGLSSEELIGQPFDAIFGQVVPLGNARANESNTPGEEALRAVFQIGPHVIQSSLARVQDLEGQHMGLVAVLRDISAERAAEQAKAEFVSTISHELRTPLTAVKGYADLLLAGAGGEMNVAQRKLAQAIHSGAERLTTIVNAVILFSEVEQGAVEIRAQPMDAGAVIAEVVGSMRPKVEACGLSLEMDIASGLPLAHADPDRTQQIIEQLLDNASRFTPTGGQLSVRAMPSWDGMNAERPSSIAITVTDTGVGLTRSDQQRIFERFYRAPNSMQVSAGGLGIGLAIARALAQAQGGHLWAESPGATDTRSGRGCKLTLLLPAIQPGGAATETADSAMWLEEALSFLDVEN